MASASTAEHVLDNRLITTTFFHISTTINLLYKDIMCIRQANLRPWETGPCFFVMFLFAGSGLVCQRGEVEKGRGGKLGACLQWVGITLLWLRKWGVKGISWSFSWWDLLFFTARFFFGGENWALTLLDNSFFIICLISFVIFLQRISRYYCNLH
ncbi:hypothetical protein GGI42DRAFT_293297 [Trichoderma sp. SZMC 28013]